MFTEKDIQDLNSIAEKIPMNLSKLFDGNKTIVCYFALCRSLISFGYASGIKKQEQLDIFKDLLEIASKAEKI